MIEIVEKSRFATLAYEGLVERECPVEIVEFADGNTVDTIRAERKNTFFEIQHFETVGIETAGIGLLMIGEMY